MRVGLADDSNLFRSGLRSLLEVVGVEVTLEASSAPELIALVGKEPPDAVITDIRMPKELEGLDAAATLKRRYPEMGVLVLSAFTESAYAERLFGEATAGLGYLLKDRVDDIHALVDALNRVCAGETVLDSTIVAALIKREQPSAEFQQLTERELDVLKHMAEGRSNAGIGQALHLSGRTIEAHVASVFTKLQIPASSDDNRRVLAVLTWMRARGSDGVG